MRGNTISMKLMRGQTCKGSLPLYQYDYGQVLILTGVSLPAAYEVHFSNTETGNSKTSIGNENGVVIPDEFLVSGSPVYVWIYLHDGSADGETEYRGMIDVYRRAKPTDQQPTPVQQSEIDQAIAALNVAVEESETNVTHYPKVENGYWYVWDAVNGEWVNTGVHAQGEPGEQGDPGYSPTATVSKSGRTATITITDKNGTTSAQISDGEDGQDGATGATPIISIGTVSKLSPGSNPTASMDTTDPEHPVLSFGLVTGDPGEVTEAELNAVAESKADIIHDTASGAIATFSDGADNLPMEMTVGIEPVQDLHGYENPWPGGATAQKWDEEWEVGMISWAGSNVQGNNQIRSKNYIPVTAETTYKIKTTNNMQFFYYNSSKEFVSYEASSKANNSTITIPAGCSYARFYTYGTSYGETYKNDIAILYPSTETSYVPYSNICPISGWTGCNVSRTGKNLLKYAPVRVTSVPSFDQSKVTWLKKNQQYVFSFGNITNATSWRTAIRLYDMSGNVYYTGNDVTSTDWNKNSNGKYYVNGSNGTLKSIVFSVNVDCYATIMFLLGDATSESVMQNAQLECGYSASDYVAYSGNTYPITFPSEAGTVYGGTLTVNKDGTGTLVETHKRVDLGSLSWTKVSNSSRGYAIVSGMETTGSTEKYDIICDSYKSATWDDNVCAICHFNAIIRISNPAFADMTGAQIATALDGVYAVYPLATPATYQLTNLEVIETLKGVNNIFADCGSVTVNYSCDTKLYIDKKFTELQALILENINNV